jgi:hypothetical protein
VGTIAAAPPDFDDQFAWIWIVRGVIRFTLHFYAILYLLMGTVSTVSVSILVMWKHHSD